jgi:single-strand DNA-binding protein
MINKVILLGNLGRDPELRYTSSGTAVCNFSVATNESYKKNGEWTNETTWHDMVIWGVSAENIQKVLSKGDLAHFEGKINKREWTDKEGVKRIATEVVVSDWKLVNKKSQDNGHREEPPPYQGVGEDVPF